MPISAMQQSHSDLYKEWETVEFDVNHLLSQKLTFLHLAAECGLLKVIKILVEAGADINKKESKDEQVPLHLAAENVMLK